MTTKEQIIDYICYTPDNSNIKILNDLLNSLPNGGIPTVKVVIDYHGDYGLVDTWTSEIIYENCDSINAFIEAHKQGLPVDAQAIITNYNMAGQVFVHWPFPLNESGEITSGMYGFAFENPTMPGLWVSWVHDMNTNEDTVESHINV